MITIYSYGREEVYGTNYWWIGITIFSMVVVVANLKVLRICNTINLILIFSILSMFFCYLFCLIIASLLVASELY